MKTIRPSSWLVAAVLFGTACTSARPFGGGDSAVDLVSGSGGSAAGSGGSVAGSGGGAGRGTAGSGGGGGGIIGSGGTGTGGTAGAVGTGGGGGARTCSDKATDCGAGMSCDLNQPGRCVASTVGGTCVVRTTSCPIEIIAAPVCGCDGQTYRDDCVRQMAGAQLDHAGACAGDGGTDATDGGTCNATNCLTPFICCGSRCINPMNDPQNCGHCGACPVGSSYCAGGQCVVPVCQAGITCGAGQTCCFSGCCGPSQLCCNVQAGPSFVGCVTPVDGTCPKGNPNAVCASPDTPIATPGGPVPIAALVPGDLVFSLDRGEVVAVPILRVGSTRVFNHHVLKVVLANGETLNMSAGHPTADGRRFADLVVGESLFGITARRIEEIPYNHSHTYDILPASDSGTYFAAGVLVGSTLASQAIALRMTPKTVSIPVDGYLAPVARSGSLR